MVTLLQWTLIALVALALLLVAAGQLGWFSGRAPADLGVRDGRLSPPSLTENSVSSQAELHRGSGALVEYAQIPPLPGGSDPSAQLERIRAIVNQMPGGREIERRPDYLYVQFTTRWMKFVDDVEFFADRAAGVVHVRSASRVGRKDFGVNRARIEAIRARLQQG